jgi:hypothetical protein
LNEVDWNLVGRVAGAGYGLTFLMLLVLALCTRLSTFVIQRTTASETEDAGSQR